MSRRSNYRRNQAFADPKFNSLPVAKFINNLMKGGKKGRAESIFYRAIDIIEDRTGQEGVTVFEQAIRNCQPVLEVKSRRVGGVTYQVPVEVRHNRRLALGIKWLISFARARSGKTMAERLAGELIDASKGEGATIKKKSDTHRMAEANRAFVHYRW